MGNQVVALDIGSSKVCALIAEMNKKQFNIVGVGTSECKGVRKGIIVDIDSTVDSIRNAVKQAEQMSNRTIKSVFVNICGGYTSLYKNKGVIAVSGDDREITPEDVKRALVAAKVVAIPNDKEIVDIIPEQFIVDGYDGIRDPIGMAGIRLEVDANLITSSCTTVQNIVRSVQRAGLSIEGIVVEPLGTSCAVLNSDEKELGVALVDIGAETMDISVFKRGSLAYTKIIQVGGNHITNDISLICKMSSADAERIKRQHGVAASNLVKEEDMIKISNIAGRGEKQIRLMDISQIMEVRINEMLYLINRELKKVNLIDSLSAGIVITGGGLFNIKGIQDVAQSHFEIPVRFGYPNFIGVASPIYSAASGIAMYSLNQKKTSILEYNNSNIHSQSYQENSDDDVNEESKSGIIEKLKDFFADIF